MTGLLSGWLAMVVLLPCAWAQDISVSVAADRRQAQLGEAVQLSVSVVGTQDVEPPPIDIEGAIVRYLGPSSQISIVNGRMSSSISHLYTVIPQRTGALHVDPLTVVADGQPYTTDALSIDVVASRAPTSPAGPAPDVAASDAFQLYIGVDATRVYTHQSVPARLQLLVGGVSVQSCSMPTLDADGVLVKPFAQPRQADVMVGSQARTLLEFDTTIVPMRAGTLTLGPASMTCQVVTRSHRQSRRRSLFGGSIVDDFFGGAQLVPITMTAESITLSVQPLPPGHMAGQAPAAVGHFTLEVTAIPTDVAVGEPVTVTMRIRGEGNFDSVGAPQLTGDTAGFKVYAPKLSESDEHSRVYEQVLIPLETSVTDIPPVTWHFFNPETARYETVRHGPMALTVRPGATNDQAIVIDQRTVAPPAAPPEILGRDIIYIKEAVGRLYPRGQHWYASIQWWWWWTSCPILLALISAGWRRRQHRLTADPGLARASGALKRAMTLCHEARRHQQQQRVTESYATIFRALQQYIGDRFNVSSSGLTANELEQTLRARGVPSVPMATIAALFARCDDARFAPGAEAADQLEAALRDTEEVLRQLDRRTGSRG